MDRHAFKDPNKPAIIYEADEQEGGRTITYGELMAEVSKLAWVLKQMGVQKGDTVALYLPMIPEAVVAFLGAAAALVARTREGERTDPQAVRWPRGKPHDDATVAYCTFQ